jgi:predicted nucleotidyltransferase
MAEPPSAYLEELVVRLRGIAGDRLVGVWLMGSAALGDFDPDRSDLDV